MLLFCCVAGADVLRHDDVGAVLVRRMISSCCIVLDRGVI